MNQLVPGNKVLASARTLEQKKDYGAVMAIHRSNLLN